ncbi:response regulator [Pseudomonas syringae pv. helianthi]|nr:response regulator [Pseudomonas syringae group genomosp. 7]UNB64594.1 response regulator [Pseudomonas syringae pv. helianthi]
MIITDFMMPVMDGLEFATAVRALPSANQLPIILMSGAQAHIGMQRSDLFDAVLPKAFNIDTIIAEVKKLLAAD